MKQTIAQRGLEFYTIDATRVAREVGLGQRINTVMQSAFYHLSGVLPRAQAVDLLKQDIVKMYSKKGPAVVAMNHTAVDQSIDELVKIDVPAAWASATGDELSYAALADPRLARARLCSLSSRLSCAASHRYGSGVPTKHLPTLDSGIALPVPNTTSSDAFKGKVAALP